MCAASRPQVGVLIVRDDSGVELLEVGDFGREIRPGEKIRLQGWYVFLRKRDMGIELSPQPVINDDGIHTALTWGGRTALDAGKIPLQLDWFNGLRDFDLEVYWAESNAPPLRVDATNLWHAVADASGRTNFLPGLRAEDYEGYWERVPDFDLLRPVKSGIVTNFDLGFRSRDEMVGIRFTGFLDVPAAGQYVFRLRSDDGSLLFLGSRQLQIVTTGFTDAPAPVQGLYGEAMGSLADRRWVTIEGRVTFVSKQGEGLEMDLRSDRDVISVGVADAAGLDPERLLNARVKICGVALGVLTTDQRVVLGRVFAASAKDIAFISQPAGAASLPITTIGGVQACPSVKRAGPCPCASGAS